MFTLMLFEAYLGWNQVKLMLNREQTINQSDLLKFHWAVEDLKRYRPIQHIIGHTEFCGLQIEVSQDVLIPRPETEEIVYRIQDIMNDRLPSLEKPQILDICTGSGCIALALKNFRSEAKVLGVDISTKALAIAKSNAKRLGMAVEFVEHDILNGTMQLPIETFDVIVSNPPYICESEKIDMSANVLDHEPGIALFVPDQDPLLFYRAIAQYAINHLSDRGFLAFEINEHLGEETCALLQGIGFTTELYKDFREKDRCIIAYKS